MLTHKDRYIKDIDDDCDCQFTKGYAKVSMYVYTRPYEDYRVGERAPHQMQQLSPYIFSLRRGNGGTSLVITLISEVPRLLCDQNTAFHDIEINIDSYWGRFGEYSSI